MNQPTPLPYDYSPWERRRTSPTTPTVTRLKLSPITSTTNLPHLSNKRSSSCHLGSRDLRSTTTAKSSAESNQIKLLQVQINFKRQMLEVSLKREEEMLNENLKLKDLLESDERKTYGNVKNLLRKYERSRGGMGKISSKFSDEISSVTEMLEVTRRNMETKRLDIENDVKRVEEKLKQKQFELQSLKSYKEKDFAIKDLQIANLERQIELIKAEHARDFAELQHIVELENDKNEKNMVKEFNAICAGVAANAAVMVPSSVDEIAMENKHLQWEIDIHLEEISRATESITACKREIEQLIADPRIDVRRTMFPELFHSPRDGDKFDIPVREWIPV